ncbi:hypothetical protein OUZ56_015915 [Daphnia magna]|uniref:Uncharacterized protein n=1 Tax=Daphnia magna TaxID=35525 RepID=A0ABR0AP75_9CRUS|nr:hypothetical protein OUZ56_015915 [Daphnia magna]
MTYVVDGFITYKDRCVQLPPDTDNDIVKSAENFAKDPFDIVYTQKKRFQPLAGCGTLLAEAKNEPITTRRHLVNIFSQLRSRLD